MFAPFAVNIAEVPRQILLVEAERVNVKIGFTITSTVSVFEQLLLSVPVTIYELLFVGVNAVPLTTPLFHV